jgi:uncharacterized peroxidase-related enzyme
MSILATPTPDEATGLVAELYQEDLDAQGYVASHTAVMALNPEAVRAWEGLIRSIARPLGTRRYELVTLAAAHGLRSRHCLLAHGARTLAFIDEPDLVRIARDYRDADLSEAEVEMMAFAERVSQDAYAMTDDDSRRLREVGFTDREIVDIALAAAARNYYSRAIQALAVEVDVPPRLSPELRDALVDGI